MKIQVEKSDRKYLYIGIALLLFGALSAFQYLSNSDLKRLIKEKKSEVEILKNYNEGLLKSVDILTIKRDSLIKISDSIEIKENYYKNKYYATNKRLQDIIDGYDNLSNDDKWDEFTKSVDN